MAASQAMLARADRLSAVWDGKPPADTAALPMSWPKQRAAAFPSLSSGRTARAGIRQRERCNLKSVAELLPADWSTTRDVATFLDVAPSTIRGYVARGQMPEANRRIGGEPVWRPETIRRWHNQRPRQPRAAE